MGREFEVKYALTEDAFRALRQRFPQLADITMETVYYDTPARELAARKWTLRRRLENGRAVCTLKTPGPMGGRGEWETECSDIESSLTALTGLGAPAELPALAGAGLERVCGARFTRLAAMVDYGGARLELALDRGVLLGGGREAPLLELEAELKQGSEDAAREFGEALAREYGLRPEPMSKFARARQLTLG